MGVSNKNKYPYEEYHKTIDGVLYKKCAYHFEIFPDEYDWFPCTDEYFYKNSKNKSDGLYPECKECTKKRAYKWQVDNHDWYREIENRLYAEGRTKKSKLFHSNKRREEGYNKKWQEENRDKCREYSKKRKNKNHKISKNEWEECLKYFDYSCAYCGMTLEEHKEKFNEQLHKEHKDDKGSVYLDNCIPACKSCNCSKHTSNIEDWYNEDNPNFTQERMDKINKWTKEDYKLYIKPKKK